MNDNTHLFQSAVDDKLFSLLLNSKTHQPSDIASIRRPRIGVIGYLDGKVLDIALLCHIADTSPTWSLVLIGPKFRHLNELEILHGRENVYFLGEKQHEEIPAYIGNLDVCMVPYRINKFTNNVSPLKLYEYMAAGKPVVSTNISDLTGFKDIIRISDSKEDFVREIALSLIEDSDELRDKRRKMAKENNWEKRLQFISGLIETMDSNRKG
jgi:glycosyltransferase involved in cell wall biosynthesis